MSYPVIFETKDLSQFVCNRRRTRCDVLLLYQKDVLLKVILDHSINPTPSVFQTIIPEVRPSLESCAFDGYKQQYK